MSPAQLMYWTYNGWSSPYWAFSRSCGALRQMLLTIPRSARDGMHQEERDHRDREQDRDDPEEAPADVTDHGTSLLAIRTSSGLEGMVRWAGLTGPPAGPRQATGGSPVLLMYMVS